MEFQPLTIPTDAEPITVDAVLLDCSFDVLAVQRVELEDGGIVYQALHVPSGANMTRHAFTDPDKALAALIEFWERLDGDTRADPAAPNSSWIRGPVVIAFRETWEIGAVVTLEREVADAS